jgi:hypothetical protein
MDLRLLAGDGRRRVLADGVAMNPLTCPRCEQMDHVQSVATV